MSPRKHSSFSLNMLLPRIMVSVLVLSAIVSVVFAGWRWYSHALANHAAAQSAKETAIQPVDSPEDFASAFREALPGLIADKSIPALERRDYLSREGQEPRSIRIRVPSSVSLTQVHIAIEALADTLGGECLSAELSADGAVLVLSTGFGDETTDLITLRKTTDIERTYGSLALLIEQPSLDDPDLLGRLCASGIPITLAVAPGTSAAEEIAVLAHNTSTPLLIIIPFDTATDESPGVAIASEDEAPAIESKLARYFRQVEGASGACITTTEGAASDPRVLEDIAYWLSRKGLVCVVAIPSGSSPAWSILQKRWVKGIVLSQRITRENDGTSKRLEEIVAGVREAGFISIAYPGDRENLTFLAQYLPIIRSRDDLRIQSLSTVIR